MFNIYSLMELILVERHVLLSMAEETATYQADRMPVYTSHHKITKLEAKAKKTFW